MQRVIAADNVEDAFRAEGYGKAVSDVVRKNKSFRASRSLRAKSVTPADPAQADKMSHGHDGD